MLKPVMLFVTYICLLPQLQAQPSFGERCLGTWQGTMYIYSNGLLKDSVEVKHTVANTAEPHTWTWKTEYLSQKMPITKDYLLRLKDPTKAIYEIEEGEGLVLFDYLFGNKLYCVFETEGVLLTATYELRNNELIFEVTSGTRISGDFAGVTNYTVSHLQTVVLKQEN